MMTSKLSEREPFHSGLLVVIVADVVEIDRGGTNKNSHSSS